MKAHRCVDGTEDGFAASDDGAETEAGDAEVFAEAVGDVEELGVDEGRGVDGEDGCEGCGGWVFGVEDGAGVDFVADEVEVVLLAEFHDVDESLSWIALSWRLALEYLRHLDQGMD